MLGDAPIQLALGMGQVVRRSSVRRRKARKKIRKKAAYRIQRVMRDVGVILEGAQEGPDTLSTPVGSIPHSAHSPSSSTFLISSAAAALPARPRREPSCFIEFKMNTRRKLRDAPEGVDPPTSPSVSPSMSSSLPSPSLLTSPSPSFHTDPRFSSSLSVAHPTTVTPSALPTGAFGPEPGRLLRGHRQKHECAGIPYMSADDVPHRGMRASADAWGGWKEEMEEEMDTKVKVAGEIGRDVARESFAPPITTTPWTAPTSMITRRRKGEYNVKGEVRRYRSAALMVKMMANDAYIGMRTLRKLLYVPKQMKCKYIKKWYTNCNASSSNGGSSMNKGGSSSSSNGIIGVNSTISSDSISTSSTTTATSKDTHGVTSYSSTQVSRDDTRALTAAASSAAPTTSTSINSSDRNVSSTSCKLSAATNGTVPSAASTIGSSAITTSTRNTTGSSTMSTTGGVAERVRATNTEIDDTLSNNLTATASGSSTISIRSSRRVRGRTSITSSRDTCVETSTSAYDACSYTSSTAHPVTSCFSSVVLSSSSPLLSSASLSPRSVFGPSLFPPSPTLYPSSPLSSSLSPPPSSLPYHFSDKWDECFFECADFEESPREQALRRAKEREGAAAPSFGPEPSPSPLCFHSYSFFSSTALNVNNHSASSFSTTFANGNPSQYARRLGRPFVPPSALRRLSRRRGLRKIPYVSYRGKGERWQHPGPSLQNRPPLNRFIPQNSLISQHRLLAQNRLPPQDRLPPPPPRPPLKKPSILRQASSYHPTTSILPSNTRRRPPMPPRQRDRFGRWVKEARSST